MPAKKKTKGKTKSCGKKEGKIKERTISVFVQKKLPQPWPTTKPSFEREAASWATDVVLGSKSLSLPYRLPCKKVCPERVKVSNADHPEQARQGDDRAHRAIYSIKNDTDRPSTAPPPSSPASPLRTSDFLTMVTSHYNVPRHTEVPTRPCSPTMRHARPASSPGRRLSLSNDLINVSSRPLPDTHFSYECRGNNQTTSIPVNQCLWEPNSITETEPHSPAPSHHPPSQKRYIGHITDPFQLLFTERAPMMLKSDIRTQIQSYSSVISHMRKFSVEVPDVYIRRCILYASLGNYHASQLDILRAKELRSRTANPTTHKLTRA